MRAIGMAWVSLLALTCAVSSARGSGEEGAPPGRLNLESATSSTAAAPSEARDPEHADCEPSRRQAVGATGSKSPLALTTTLSNGRLQVSDDTHKMMLFVPTAQPVVGTGALSPKVTLVPRSEGFDMRLEFDNRAAKEPRQPATIALDGWRLGTWVGWRDFRYDAAERSLRQDWPPTHNSKYPGELYSPVAVLSNVVKDGRAQGQYTIGVSVSYPLIESGEQVRFRLLNNDSAATPCVEGCIRNTQIEFINPVPAGTQFEATVSVRVIDGAENWIRTLVPYRDYFRCMYGNVQYTRDTRPVQGFTTTQVTALSDKSPHGFGWGPSKNPDVAGWGPLLMQDVATAPKRGYQRTMIWTPSGLYRTHSYNPPLGLTTVQYPFQFMTHMNDVPAMASSLDAFGKLPSGLSLGFWWGTSLQLRRTWDAPPSSIEPLDPDRADHRQLGFAELDMARKLGATAIGLDAFVWIGPKGLRWLDAMRSHAPEVKFIGEGFPWDVLHVRVPVWRDGFQLSTPQVLADLLIPGYETWCSVDPGRYAYDSNKVATETRRLASLGCTIVMTDNVPMPPNVTVPATWETTIPADLR